MAISASISDSVGPKVACVRKRAASLRLAGLSRTIDLSPPPSSLSVGAALLPSADAVLLLAWATLLPALPPPLLPPPQPASSRAAISALANAARGGVAMVERCASAPVAGLKSRVVTGFPDVPMRQPPLVKHRQAHLHAVTHLDL